MNDPIQYDDLVQRVPGRSRSVGELDAAVTSTMFLAGADPVVRATDAVLSEHTEAGSTYRLDIEVERRRVGVHAFPPSPEVTRLDRRRRLLDPAQYTEQLTGFVPDHLDLRVRPTPLEQRLQSPQWTRTAGRGNQPTTIFGTDDRMVFSDTAYPWSTTGRVTIPGGTASGTMVGPRHMLTVSHAIQWINPPNPNGAGWVTFAPSFFDGSTPFGTANAQHVYYQYQVAGDIDGTEEQYDYVVVVLDRRIGELTGWMGARSYTDSWDNGAYWSHVGYPGDRPYGSNRPTFQGSIALDGSESEPDEHEALRHTGDVWPGQSGGPMFGWWDGDPFPYVVGVQSWQNRRTNAASGGATMVDLIIRARNEFP